MKKQLVEIIAILIGGITAVLYIFLIAKILEVLLSIS